MNNKALMGFAISVAGVVAGLYVYKMLTKDETTSSSSTGAAASTGMTPFRGRRR